MTAARRLGLLGGTLDPVHYGHLDAADAARTALGLDEVWFIPSHDPPHKPIDPQTNGYQRFALVSLAINDRSGLRACDLELRREGLSYTIETFRSLHLDGWQPSQLFFIIGTDAFAEIATWREYPAVLDQSNFVVIARPGFTLASSLARTPDVRARVRDLTHQARSRTDTAVFVVEAVTRDVSSTSIRARLAAGQAIDDLVPPAVARHIAAHDLYKAVNHLHG
jgi:nicotinate-nucleotide adenylyltransferase